MEPVSRLDSVPYIVVNGKWNVKESPPELAQAYQMSMKPTYLINLLSGEKKPFRGAPFNMGTTLHAVTGIGNPNRFFDLLAELPYQVSRHDFPDHHPFSKEDFEALELNERQPIVMTEKDAVKCQPFAAANYWYLAVEVELPDELLHKLLGDIRQMVEQRKAQTKSTNNLMQPHQQNENFRNES